MRKFIKILCASVILIAIVSLLSVCAFADDVALYTGNLGMSSKGEESHGKISYGLDVLATENKIEFAGIMGYTLNFSKSKFACAMNLSSIEKIEVLRLMPSDEGELYLGGYPIECGQIISGGSLEMMEFESTGKNNSSTPSTFYIKVNGSDYEIACDVYMLDGINESPSVLSASAISLNIETYKSVCVGGILCATDPEGDDIVYEIVSYPKNGYITMTNKSSGEYIYTPASGYTGKDEFVYVVKDKYGNYSSAATVKVNVSTQYSNVVYNDLIDDGNYYYALNMTDKNVMNGEKVGDYYYFRPDAEVTRVDFVVSAMKALGIENIPSVEFTVFADDDAIGDEVRGYVSLAYSKGYISGIQDSGKLYFRPDENITLSEAAVIISNIIGYSEIQSAPTFANGDEIPTWSRQAVISLKTLGVLEVSSGSTFKNTNVDRGCMAKLLSRAAWVTENI